MHRQNTQTARPYGTPWTKHMEVWVWYAAVLPVWLVYGEVNHHATAHKDLTRTEMTELMEYIFSLSEVQRAVRHMAFHRVWRSAYSGGAWDGKRISEQITPPLRV